MSLGDVVRNAETAGIWRKESGNQALKCLCTPKAHRIKITRTTEEINSNNRQCLCSLHPKSAQNHRHSKRGAECRGFVRFFMGGVQRLNRRLMPRSGVCNQPGKTIRDDPRRCEPSSWQRSAGQASARAGNFREGGGAAPVMREKFSGGLPSPPPKNSRLVIGRRLHAAPRWPFNKKRRPACQGGVDRGALFIQAKLAARIDRGKEAASLSSV